MTELRAAVLEGPADLRLRDVRAPAAADGYASARIARVGVCGTDVSIFTGATPVRYPRVMGHEMVGELVAGAGSLPAGTRVVVDPSISCGRCFQCRAGQENICVNGALIGRDTDGAFADVVAVPEENLHAIPDSISDEEAPLVQVLTTCLHGHGLTPVLPGESVAVIGLGVTGLLHVQLAKLRGARPVIAITRTASKRDLAQRLGADIVLDPSADLEACILEATRGGGADVVVESAGKIGTLATAIGAVRPGGRIMQYGTITASHGELPFYELYRKEITITDPRAARREDFPAAIDLVAGGSVDVASLITHTFSLERAPEALATASASSSLKVVLDLDHDDDRR